MAKLTAEQRESRIKRVYDLHKEGLSLRKIKAQIETEGFSAAIGQIAKDIRVAKAKADLLIGYIPFWCDNKTTNYPNCCFNHRVGMPSEGSVKKQGRVPMIYDYQMEIFNAVQEHRRVLLVKSRKIGATALMKRASIQRYSFLTIALAGDHDRVAVARHEAAPLGGVRREVLRGVLVERRPDL